MPTAIWPPEMQAERVIVDILASRWMILYSAFFRVKEHILNLAHFLPCRAERSLLVAGGYAHMVPSSAVRCDAKERPAFYENLKAPVLAVS